MPIIDRRDRNNWFDSIPVAEDAETRVRRYYAENVKENEIRCGDVILAKIPRIKGRISRRNVRNGSGHGTTYIELILEKSYDKEKHQSRNKRVIVGIDVSDIYHGMMIINEHYHDYFDREGNLINIPEVTEKSEVAEEQRNARTASVSANATEEKKDAAVEEQQNMKQNTLSEKKQNTGSNTVKYVEDRKPGNQIPADVNPEETKNMNPYEPDDSEEQEDEEEAKYRHINDYAEFLSDLLHRYKETIDEQAKKRPDRHLSMYQTRRINELLEALRYFFKDFETIDYLKLAEEPSEEDPKNTGMTYADMAILLSAYVSTMWSYRLDKLWFKENNQKT